ncbi:MAG TPA: hypothetical protein VFZ18_10740 [Longimicrobiaceae bacterium]
MKRRVFLQSMSETLAACALGGLAATPAAARPRRLDAQAIDRRARLARHDPVVRSVDPTATLSVGNGKFVFTADVTGLQTFPDAYTELPLATQAEWGWHSFPNPEGYALEQALTLYDSHGRPVPYADRQNSPAGAWLRQNPHRLSLARVGFQLMRDAGTEAAASDLTDIDQRLELWSGTLVSRFRLDGRQVQVTSWAHPERDLLAVRVEAPDLPAGRLAIRFAFPYGSTVHTGDPADWSSPERHSTEVARQGPGEIAWTRTLDSDSYAVRAAWHGGEATMEREGAHRFRLAPASPLGRLDLVVDFAPQAASDPLPAVEAVGAASAAAWERFWTSGAVVDLSGTTDARARELERRIVLSEYLTAIQCAGSMPPQETGLTFNSWHGKSHLEMHWWHAAHFALWDRVDLLRRSLPWYRKVLPRARETARMQGYAGARWGKMIDPDGRESPSGIGPFLVWQQPHPIYYAELVYRATEDPAFLAEYAEVVFQTAEFMATYPFHDRANDRYVLGPPLIPAQELHPARTTFNPTFELAYWGFALETAQRWRERLGLPREPQWERVLRGLSKLPVRDGLYLNAESDPVTWTDIDKRRDHPSLLGAYGFVPATDRVDPETMRRTLRRVMTDWQWEETWGWDYPLTAMTAARLGEPETAIDALLMDTVKNRYHPNGHNYQRPGLTIYLPGNGGLLYATGMMAGGWDGAPAAAAPGFPRSWTVRSEGLRRAP